MNALVKSAFVDDVVSASVGYCQSALAFFSSLKLDFDRYVHSLFNSMFSLFYIYSLMVLFVSVWLSICVVHIN